MTVEEQKGPQRQERVSEAGTEEGWQLQKEEQYDNRRKTSKGAGAQEQRLFLTKIECKAIAHNLRQGHKAGSVLCNTASDD